MIEDIPKYWPIILFCLGAVGTIIKMYFDVIAMKKWMKQHDQADKDMKDELITMIDRNKRATDDAAKGINDKLDTIHTTVTELNLMNKLLLENKLKT